MQTTASNLGYILQYAVIGRLNKDHGAYALNPLQIKQHIASALSIDVDPNTIIHIPPNFIIQLDNGHQQAHVLATHPLLHTNYFLLEILPWSKEHERCQLPWIPTFGSKTSEIRIDPLTILPVISGGTKQRASIKLKDTFASMIPRNYDLRSPDFSYLAIAEIKDFYYMKASIFRNYKKAFSSLQHVNHDFYPTIHKQVSTLCTYINSLQCPPTIEAMPHVHAFAIDLKNADMAIGKAIGHLDSSAAKMCTDHGNPIDLQGFNNPPSSTQVATPPRYADRLKAIFIATIEKLHNTTPIIETIKDRNNSIQTYITISNFTRKYYGDSEKTTEEMEAAAIFYWLKQICHIQGYKIMDLNYLTLAEIVSSIDRWNLQMNILDFLVNFITQETKSMHKEISKAYEAANVQEAGPFHSEYITTETYRLLNILDHYYISINNIAHQIWSSKEQYNITRFDGYSPSRSYYRLARAIRPVIQPPVP